MMRRAANGAATQIADGRHVAAIGCGCAGSTHRESRVARVAVEVYPERRDVDGA